MHAHTHTHTRTRPCAYARARTLAARESSQNIVGGGGIPAFEAAGIPVVEVHEGAKRPGMWFIPDSLWESLAVGRVVASARSTDAGRR